MMGSESQVWRSLNVNLIILGWLERKKDVQWCDGKLGMWRQLLGINAGFRGKRAMRGAYRWSGVRYQTRKFNFKNTLYCLIYTACYYFNIEVTNEIFYILFFILRLPNLMCILHSQHISI